jgi:gentisate 1,2-dioxygenase
MSRGDLLLTPGWNFHGHHNNTDKPIAKDAPLTRLLPINQLSEVLRYFVRDFERRGCSKMSIARRCLRLRVA